MTVRVLARHPAPYPTEDSGGYLLRLSELNGYPNPYYMLMDCGISRWGGGIGRKIRCAVLSQITNRRSNELERIATVAAEDGSGMLLGQAVPRHQIVALRSAVCPECVHQSGMIEAHFSLKLMTVCPVHAMPLVNLCADCMQLLTWKRRGLLECECGGVARRTENVHTPVAVVELLEIVRRKVLSLPIRENSKCGLPVMALGSMSLRALVYLITMLGARTISEREEVDGGDSDEAIVDGAAKLLSNWPYNLRNRLEALAASSLAPCALSSSPLSAMYYSVRRRVRPTEEAGFLLDEITCVAADRFGDWHQSGKLLGEAKRFVTRNALAARLGISGERANKVIQEGKLPTIHLDVSPKRPRVLVDISTVQIASRAPGKVHRPRNAAAIIGISANTLNTIRALGMFEARHLPPGIRGFHEKDCEAYRQKLLQIAEDGTAEREDRPLVRLGTILHGAGTNALTKARLVSEVHAGRIPVIGVEGNSVKGILLSNAAVQSFLQTNQNPDWSSLRGRGRHNTTSNRYGGISTTQAMREIDCSVDSVRGLVRQRVLVKASGGRRGTHWILAKSVDEFRAEYVSLKSLAREFHTCERILRTVCKKLDVKLLSVESENTVAGSFLSKGDLPTVRSFQHEIGIGRPRTRYRWESFAA